MSNMTLEISKIGRHRTQWLVGGCPPSSPSFSSLRRQHKWIAWTSACAAVASKLSRSKLATEYSEWGVVALGVAMVRLRRCWGSSLGEILTKGSVVLSCDSSPSLNPASVRLQPDPSPAAIDTLNPTTPLRQIGIAPGSPLAHRARGLPPWQQAMQWTRF